MISVKTLDGEEELEDADMSDEEQKLRDAAQRGDTGEVARLIESGVSVNSTTKVNYVNTRDQVHWV